MKEFDIVVIGGSAAGLTTAITAKRHYPEKSVLIIRGEEKVLIPCGIPYIFGTVNSPENNLIPDAVLEKNQIELMIDVVSEIDREKKIVATSNENIKYDRLVLATGSEPAIPKIEGADKKGVYAIYKQVDYLKAMQRELNTAQKIIIIGGGFIGIELADEINKMGSKEVTVIEIATHCLSLAYDKEFCVQMEDQVTSRGVKLMTSSQVESVVGSDSIEAVALTDGKKIPADMVVLGIGAKPNVELAEKSGLRIGRTGSIIVDRTMRTSDDAIFACGDCAKKWAFFGGRPSTLKLASIATSEARIVGANLFGVKRENIGTVGVWSTAVGNLAMGTAGLTESVANEMGYQIVSVTIEGPNRHPGGMPGMTKSRLKMVFEVHSGVLLGGQVSGDATAGEIINIVSACIQSKMTAEQIAMFQTGTHPALTASPIAYPLVNAAEEAIKKIKGIKKEGK